MLKQRFQLAKDTLLDAYKAYKSKRFMNYYEKGRVDAALKYGLHNYKNISINDHSLIFYAISQQDTPFLERLLGGEGNKKQNNINPILNENNNPNKFYPLTFAVLNQQHHITDLLLKHGANLHLKHDQGNTLLHLSAFNDKLDAVRFCISNQFDLDQQNDQGNTPLHLAAIGGHTQIVEQLLSEKADPCILNLNQFSAIHEAVFYSHFESYKLLEFSLSKVRMKQQTDIVHLASQLPEQQILMDLLKNKPILANMKDDIAYPLHYAVGAKVVDNVRLLLQNQAQVNAADRFGNTALHLAVQYKQLDICRLLVEAGADASIQNEDRLTPVDIAIGERDNVMLDYLKTVTRYTDLFRR